MPKISVIIPAYNCAALVTNAVDSVFSQTMQDCEVIVVDDGSTDNTSQVLQPYFSNPRFRYVRQENRGIPGARNAGARLSDAEYLAFLDEDDTLPPEALATMSAALDASGATWCITDILRIAGNRREVCRTVLPPGDLLLEELRDNFIFRAIFFRRRNFVELGMYDETQVFAEDWELHIRLLESREPFVYLNQPLYIYLWRREGSLTALQNFGNPSRSLAGMEAMFRKHHKRLADGGNRAVRKIYAQHMWWLGRRHFYETKNYRKAFACIRESLAHDPSPVRVFHPFLHYLRRFRQSRRQGELQDSCR